MAIPLSRTCARLLAACALLPLAALTGCKDSAATTTTTGAVNTSPADSRITSSEMARALGMSRIQVQLPDGSDRISYGLALRHHDGCISSGFGSFPGGTLVTVIYWREGQHLKCSLQSATGSYGSQLDLAKLPEFYTMTSLDHTRICAPGDLFERWSVNTETNWSADNRQLAAGEVGLCLISKEDAGASKPFVAPPAPANQTPADGGEKKPTANF